MSEQPATNRRDAARRMAEMAESAKRAEAQSAQVLIDEFVVRARARGLKPERLVATQMDGRPAKTDKTGWYLNRSRSIAIGEDGSWYVLTVPTISRWGRMKGVSLVASPPEMVVGRGARDGESGDLSEFLDRLLP
ncbi:MAG: hypothetical protein QM708_08785 [Propioniciclava sp.]|uniref:hypothetical protein n=1 Tax=Propioniciclava sp. TaxID=2038686 RepID=UPI0039E6D6E0